MRVTYCDICFEVIKPGRKKYVLGIHTMQQHEPKEKFREQLSNYDYVMPKVELFEVCGECRKVLDHFFHIRKEELLKMQDELKKIFKKRTGENKK